MKNTLLRQTDETYSNYRIPGIVITNKGTVLTYYEARRTSSDWAHMDILLYRSEDGGDTFGDAIVIAEGTDAFPTVNNPVCIVDEDNTLHMLYCRNYSVDGGDVFYRRSEDDGKTWSAPRNIMASTRPQLHNAYALGPGHGIRTKDGTLLTPIWMVLKSENMPLHSHNPAVVSVLYSRDHGESWHSGDIISAEPDIHDPNETQAALLSDGSVYFNTRTTATGFRAYTTSVTGYDAFRPLSYDKRLIDPTCFGSTASGVVNGTHVLLVVNCAHTQERENLVCRLSYDDGRTWKKTLTVEPGDAGYADIALCEDGTVFVLYEQRAGVCDRLAVFTLDEFR